MKTLTNLELVNPKPYTVDTISFLQSKYKSIVRIDSIYQPHYPKSFEGAFVQKIGNLYYVMAFGKEWREYPKYVGVQAVVWSTDVLEIFDALPTDEEIISVYNTWMESLNYGNNPELKKEFAEIKKELFGDSMFAVIDDENPLWKRYNELFLIFYPMFKRIPEVSSNITKQVLPIDEELHIYNNLREIQK